MAKSNPFANLASLSIRQLREIARSLGVKRYSSEDRVGLADAIVDLVSTGNTLRANNLIEVERIMDISARLIVNQAALKLKREPIRRIIDAFGAVVGASGPSGA